MAGDRAPGGLAGAETEEPRRPGEATGRVDRCSSRAAQGTAQVQGAHQKRSAVRHQETAGPRAPAGRYAPEDRQEKRSLIHVPPSPTDVPEGQRSRAAPGPGPDGTGPRATALRPLPGPAS